MKNMKKWIVALLAVVMVCHGGVAAMAADKAAAAPDAVAAPYTVDVTRAKMNILQDGKAVKTYEMSSSDFTVAKGKEKGTVAVRFWDDNGKQCKINLGEMDEIFIDGKIMKLTISSTLSKDVKVVIGKDCSVSDMRVNNASKVSVYGIVKELDIANKDARVTEERQGEIREVSTVSTNAIKGVFSEHITKYDPDEE